VVVLTVAVDVDIATIQTGASFNFVNIDKLFFQCFQLLLLSRCFNSTVAAVAVVVNAVVKLSLISCCYCCCFVVVVEVNLLLLSSFFVAVIKVVVAVVITTKTFVNFDMLFFPVFFNPSPISVVSPSFFFLGLNFVLIFWVESLR